jgi:nucleotide-binding universal stress UspA family protein
LSAPYGYRVLQDWCNGTKKVTGQILVPLRRNDRIEDVLPYLEQIARPGSRVILLIHYSVEGIDWLQSKSTTSLIKEQKLVDKNTFLALEPLRERDVTVALDIYAGSLRKVVSQYTLRGDIDLVMIAARGKSWIRRLFQNCLFFGSFSGVSKSSVLLLHPDIPKNQQ